MALSHFSCSDLGTTCTEKPPWGPVYVAVTKVDVSMDRTFFFSMPLSRNDTHSFSLTATVKSSLMAQLDLNRVGGHVVGPRVKGREGDVTQSTTKIKP